MPYIWHPIGKSAEGGGWVVAGASIAIAGEVLHDEELQKAGGPESLYRDTARRMCRERSWAKYLSPKVAIPLSFDPRYKGRRDGGFLTESFLQVKSRIISHYIIFSNFACSKSNNSLFEK